MVAAVYRQSGGAGRGAGGSYFAALSRYRHFLFNLVGSDLRSRFRRSYLGIFWAALQPLCWALLLGSVYATVFHMDFFRYVPYLFSGTIAWELISSSIIIGLHGLLVAEGYLRQARIPLLVFQARVPMTASVIYLFGLVAYFVFFGFSGQLQFGLHTLLGVAVLPVLLFISIPMSVIFSILGTLFRDLHHITILATQALWLLSPVIMPREVFEAPNLAFMEWANPVVAAVDLVRDPIFNNRYWDPFDLAVIGVWGLILWSVAIVLSVIDGRKAVFRL